MIRNIIFPDIYNKIASIYSSIRSFLIIYVVIKDVKTGIRAVRELGDDALFIESKDACLATSAYVSIAFIFFLFFSAVGRITFRTARRSETLAKLSFRNVRR